MMTPKFRLFLYNAYLGVRLCGIWIDARAALKPEIGREKSRVWPMQSIHDGFTEVITETCDNWYLHLVSYHFVMIKKFFFSFFFCHLDILGKVGCIGFPEATPRHFETAREEAARASRLEGQRLFWFFSGFISSAYIWYWWKNDSNCGYEERS